MLFFNLDMTFRRCHNMYMRGGGLKKLSLFLMSITNIIHSSDIPVGTTIGKNVHFGHRGIGIVIHEKAIIGEGTTVMQNVTIDGTRNGYPVINNNVLIGAGAIILGNVVVGEGAIIGANAVVVKNVAPYTVVGGVPARVLRKLE